MSPVPALLGLLALALGFRGVREIFRESDVIEAGGSRPDRPGRLSAASLDGEDVLGLGERIRRAGLAGVLLPRAVLMAKGAGAALGALAGSLFAGLLPGRLAPLLVSGAAAAMFLLPDLLLERAARRRHRRMVVALPDVLDLLAVSVTAGRGLAGSFADLAGSGRGPLVEELARAGEDMAWGSGQRAALEGLRTRIGGPEIASFCSTLERSRRLGSPLADQLRRQSATLRQNQRRAIEEEAARAAPKIQLVIALVLVPSVLLLMVAALAANAGSLLNSAGWGAG